MIFPLFFKPNPLHKANIRYDIIWESNGTKLNYDEAREWEREHAPEIAEFRIKEVRFGINKIITINAKDEKIITKLDSEKNTITETFYSKKKTIEKTTVYNENSVDYIAVKIRNKE